MPIIRKQLKPADVYPDNIRYNAGTDAVQSLINGNWVDNPEADPRHQTNLPPRATSQTDCDAAQSVVDALKGQIAGISDAIENGSTLFTIAGIILSIFTFGAFAVFISIALTIGDAMLNAGTAAIEAALTNTVWEQLRCIIFCQMDDNGRIDAAGLTAIETKVNDQIGGLGATIINSMLSLAGEGGINNLGAIGTSTGDCSGCGCAPVCEEALNPDNWTFGIVISAVIEAGGTILYELASEDNGGTQNVQWKDKGTEGCCCVVDYLIHNPDSLPGYWTSQCGANQYNFSIEPTNVCAEGFAIYQNSISTPFLIGVRFKCACDAPGACEGDCV